MPGQGERTAKAPVSWARRVGWFVLLWAVSILALGAVAYGIRLMIL